MKATKIEFRLRMVIMTLIVIMGFWAPWIQIWGIGNRFPLWAWLTLEVNHLGLVSSAVSAPLVIVVAALIAAKGAVLRIWAQLAWDTTPSTTSRCRPAR